MWARVENGIVMELIDFNPQGCFTDEIVAQFIRVPDGIQVQRGWSCVNGVFAAPAGPTLTEAQQAKIAEAESAYWVVFNGTFTSSATKAFPAPGTDQANATEPLNYDFSTKSQAYWESLFNQMDKNLIPDSYFPRLITIANGTNVLHTKAALGQIEQELTLRGIDLYDKLQLMVAANGSIMFCTTIDQVNLVDYNDASIPAVPSGLAYGSGTLNWVKNTDADLWGYNVYQSSDNKAFTKVNASVLTSPTFTPTGLTAGTTYYFVATAVDLNINESAQCASVSVTA